LAFSEKYFVSEYEIKNISKKVLKLMKCTPIYELIKTNLKYSIYENTPRSINILIETKCSN